MILVFVILAVVISYYAALHRAEIFNARDKSGDYRTSPQRFNDKSPLTSPDKLE